MSVNFDAELERMDQHLLKTFGAEVTFEFGGETKTLHASVESEMRIGSESGGFTNRYGNQAGDLLAKQWVATFQKSELSAQSIDAKSLDGTVITKAGTQYELQSVVDEDEGMITYGAARF